MIGTTVSGYSILERDVAVKVLPEGMAERPERMACSGAGQPSAASPAYERITPLRNSGRVPWGRRPRGDSVAIRRNSPSRG